MRFEVKGGGFAGILFALTLLSGAVFVLGLLAGYDVGRQAQIDTTQLATSYPLQSASSSPAPSSQPPSAAGNTTMQAASNSPSQAIDRHTLAPAAATNHNSTGEPNTPGATPSRSSRVPAQNRFVAASIPPPVPSPASHLSAAAGGSSSEAENTDAVDQSSEAPSDTGPEIGRKVASAAQPPRHKPYNIQIEAAMDISGADQMMARLQRLGYPSHLVPTEIGGQRWYKVEVGPYATAEEASSAEATLRQRYDATYGGVARRNSAAQGANEDSEE